MLGRVHRPFSGPISLTQQIASHELVHLHREDVNLSVVSVMSCVDFFFFFFFFFFDGSD